MSFIESLLPCQILGVCAYNLSRRLGAALAIYFGVLTPAFTFGLLMYLQKEQPNEAVSWQNCSPLFCQPFNCCWAWRCRLFVRAS